MAKNSKTFSFEFFPPKTASGQEKVISLGKEFESVPAEYYSVTFGAGGSTQLGTIETCRSLFNATKSVRFCFTSALSSSKRRTSFSLFHFSQVLSLISVINSCKSMTEKSSNENGFHSTTVVTSQAPFTKSTA